MYNGLGKVGKNSIDALFAAKGCAMSHHLCRTTSSLLQSKCIPPRALVHQILSHPLHRTDPYSATSSSTFVVTFNPPLPPLSSPPPLLYPLFPPLDIYLLVSLRRAILRIPFSLSAVTSSLCDSVPAVPCPLSLKL